MPQAGTDSEPLGDDPDVLRRRIRELELENALMREAVRGVFRQIGVNSVGTYSGHCRRSGWTVWAVGWFPLFVGYFMSEWVFR